MRELCLNFANKCVKNTKLEHMIPRNEKSHGMGTRKEEALKVQHATKERLKQSTIIYMQNLLNQQENIYKSDILYPTCFNLMSEVCGEFLCVVSSVNLIECYITEIYLSLYLLKTKLFANAPALPYRRFV